MNQRKAKSTSRIERASSRRLVAWLGLSFVIPLGILSALATLEVKLGQGYFFYRYSPIRDQRIWHAIPIVAVGGVAAIGVWMLARRRAPRDSVIAIALLLASLFAAGAWAWWAPPLYLAQHWFNLTSPSADGAFIIEARGIHDMPGYLRAFPQRLRVTPEQMGGTRVLSNPPGTTIVAHAIIFAPIPRTPMTEAFEPALIEQGVPPAQAAVSARGLWVGVAFVGLWVLSGAAAYGLGRVFLSPAGAAVFAVIVTFNPCTVHFVPGKDPAQLLAINLMLWSWLAGWKRGGSIALGTITGAFLVLGAIFGLVQIWIAAILFAATLWESLAASRLRDALRLTLSAMAGAGLSVLLVYLAIGWNIPAALLAASRRWGELQGTFQMNRGVWYAIGLPIFLLFLSPGIVTLAGLSIQRRRLNFGARMAICTIAVMLVIYFVVGLTYELPRLWVAFLPPLVLGLAMNRPLLSGATPRREVAMALALIVIAQVAFTAMHWTLLDAREAEYRLSTQRFYR